MYDTWYTESCSYVWTQSESGGEGNGDDSKLDDDIIPSLSPFDNNKLNSAVKLQTKIYMHSDKSMSTP